MGASVHASPFASTLARPLARPLAGLGGRAKSSSVVTSPRDGRVQGEAPHVLVDPERHLERRAGALLAVGALAEAAADADLVREARPIGSLTQGHDSPL